MSCYKTGDFVRYWEENMRQLGMWVPEGSYEAFGGMTGLIASVAAAIETNPGITLYKALVNSKVTIVATSAMALSASAWVGAAIGSAAVAAGRSLACGTTIAEALWTARNDFQIYGSWLESEFISHPEFIRGR